MPLEIETATPSLHAPEARIARLKQAAKIVVTIGLLFTIVWVLDAEKLARAIVDINLAWLGVSIVASAAFVATRIAKWTLLTRGNGLHAPVADIARLTLMSLALGILTPGRVGEVVAVASFPREHRAKAVMVYLYDRIGELCTVLLFCIPAVVLFLGAWGAALGAAIVAGCVGAVMLVEWRGLRLKFGEITRLDRFAKANAVLSADVRARPSYWLVSVVTYVLAYALVAALIVGAQSGISLAGVCVLPVVTLSNLITITIGGLGVREGLAAAMAPLADMSPEVTAAAFFLSFVFTRVIPGIIGLIWASVAPTNKARPSPRLSRRREGRVEP